MKPKVEQAAGLAMVILISCASPPTAPAATAAPVCPELPAPTMITIAEPKYGERHEVFDLADTPALWAPAPEDEAAKQYRAALAPRVGDLAPRALLERQRAALAKLPNPREAANIEPILAGSGTFVTPSCLERRLFARQAARYPLVEHPTELGAFVLQGNGRVRVYFSTMDLVGQKIRHEVTDRVAEDLKHGYRHVAHLHSHPFLLDRKVGDRMWTTEESLTDVAGALAPSLADGQLWKSAGTELSLESGWITNGLDSVRVPNSEFAKLAGHGD